MEFLAWLESNALSTWVRESPSIWAYPTVLTLHTIGLGILVGANSVVALRILGLAPRVPLAPLEWLFPAMSVGFAVNGLSGVVLFAIGATVWVTHPLMIIKLILVAAGMVNISLLRTSMFHNPTGIEAGTVSGRTTNLARASLAIWVGVIIAGRYTAYFFHPITSL